ncbi:MAG: hypothetical protein R6U57_12585 [Anaerolineales bacterium]
MNTKSLSPLAPEKPWPRDYLIHLARIALAVEEPSFVRKAALSWLAVYPGDLTVQLLHAQALWEEERFEQAFNIADDLCHFDPEYAEAQELRVLLADHLDHPDQKRFWGELFAIKPDANLFQTTTVEEIVPDWSQDITLVRSHLKDEDIESANHGLQDILGSDPPSPLAAVTHLNTMIADPETPDNAIRDLAEHYLSKYPNCLLCTLVLGETLIKAGQSEKGVGMLHKAASQDISGQVAQRLWGKDHAYRDLWPEHMSAHLGLPVPAKVAASLGWNQLPEGDRRYQKSSGEEKERESHLRENAEKADRGVADEGMPPETLKSIQEELEKVARKLGKQTVIRSDGRFPMYIVFSTQKGLVDTYGPKTAGIIKEEMKKVSRAVRLKPGWGSITLFADDPNSMANFDLKPTRADDAWALKLALADLDRALGKKGLMIGALLIVGGPDVIPYHHLPNPVEDVDKDVPSDNPYATQDENYFIPEWPVGRVPGGKGNDPGVLLDTLRQIADHHMGKGKPEQTWWQSIWQKILEYLSISKKTNPSFGYAAEAWKKASDIVFQPIHEKVDVVTSPPFGKHTEIPVPVTQLGYFNLHGVENDASWYGQKDLTNGSGGPDYPVALHPEDISVYEDAPLFVFTEACYGIHLNGRTVDESIALSYLSKGSYTVVGSTVTSYGSIGAPLIAADLLAESYWKYIKEGCTSGEALQKSKIRMAKIMHNRQGYLDGEDQKTLISFNLFGDPLASPQDAKRKQAKMALRPKRTSTIVKTVCDRSSITTDIPAETLRHVKKVVKHYLPGMEDAQMVLSMEENHCEGKGHRCPTSNLGKGVQPEPHAKRQVVTLSKSFDCPHKDGVLTHRHYARVTFNEKGEMVKLAVSR